MIVLGLDPGIANFGYGVVQHSGGNVSYLVAGVVKTPADSPTSDRLVTIAATLRSVIEEHRPEQVVIERLVPGPQRNLGTVSEARGAALLVIGEAELPYTEESPKAVKALTTRHGSATKLQIRKTIQRLLGMEELPPADAADALALAILGRSIPVGNRS